MASQKASLGSGDLRSIASRTASRQERRRTSQTLGLPSPQVLKADRKVPDGRPRSMRLAGRPLVDGSVSGRSPASVRATLVSWDPRTRPIAIVVCAGPHPARARQRGVSGTQRRHAQAGSARHGVTPHAPCGPGTSCSCGAGHCVSPQTLCARRPSVPVYIHVCGLTPARERSLPRYVYMRSAREPRLPGSGSCARHDPAGSTHDATVAPDGDARAPGGRGSRGTVALADSRRARERAALTAVAVRRTDATVSRRPTSSRTRGGAGSGLCVRTQEDAVRGVSQQSGERATASSNSLSA